MTVHPLQFAALAADPDVREFQVVQDGDRLTLRIVPTPGARIARVAERLTRQISAALRDLGVADPQLAIEPYDAIARSASGKLELVVADPRPRAVA